jgi:hypothetical protein
MRRLQERLKDSAIGRAAPAIRGLLVVVLTVIAAILLFLLYPRIDQALPRVGTVVAVIVCMTVAVLLVPPDLHRRWGGFVRTALAVAAVVSLLLQLLGDGGGGASSAAASTSPRSTTSSTIPQDPAILLEPTSAPVGSSFLVKGTNFAPNKVVRIDMGAYIVVEGVRTGAAGSFSESVYLFPGKYWVAGETYTVTAIQGDEELSASATFQVSD